MWSKCSHGRDNFQKLILTQTPSLTLVSIMVNKHAYKPSLKDIMDKYYEMFHGRNHTNKTDFFNRTEDSDADA
jgi:hypothetical protein